MERKERLDRIQQFILKKGIPGTEIGLGAWSSLGGQAIVVFSHDPKVIVGGAVVTLFGAVHLVVGAALSRR